MNQPVRIIGNDQSGNTCCLEKSNNLDTDHVRAVGFQKFTSRILVLPEELLFKIQICITFWNDKIHFI